MLVGPAWPRVRPESRFGPLLIGFGAVSILRPSSNPWLFGTGVRQNTVADSRSSSGQFGRVLHAADRPPQVVGVVDAAPATPDCARRGW
jgi:hypothetical protein